MTTEERLARIEEHLGLSGLVEASIEIGPLRWDEYNELRAALESTDAIMWKYGVSWSTRETLIEDGIVRTLITITGPAGMTPPEVIDLADLTSDQRGEVELLCSDTRLGEEELLALVMVRCMALYRGSKRKSMSKRGPIYESLWDAGKKFSTPHTRR